MTDQGNNHPISSQAPENAQQTIEIQKASADIRDSLGIIVILTLKNNQSQII